MSTPDSPSSSADSAANPPASPGTGAGSASSSAAPASAPTAVPANMADFFAALGNPLRWSVVKMLADGRAMSATDAAAALGRDFDGVSKHLRVLREAGVLTWRAGEDRRLALYSIPDSVRRADGVLDYGFCVIRTV